MTVKLVQFAPSESGEKPVGPVDMRKTRVCMNTRAEVFAAQTHGRYLGTGLQGKSK